MYSIFFISIILESKNFIQLDYIAVGKKIPGDPVPVFIADVEHRETGVCFGQYFIECRPELCFTADEKTILQLYV